MGQAGLTLQIGGAQQFTSALAQIDAILGHIDQKLDKYADGFDRVNNSLGRLAGNFVSTLTGQLLNLDTVLSNTVTNMGRRLEESGKALAQQGLMELSLFGLPAFFGSQVVKTAADFSQIVKQIELINGALDKTFGPEQLERIIQGINEFSQRTIFTSTESARALLQIQKAGFDAADSLRILNDAGNLAASDGTVSLEKAQFGLIQTMKLANLTAEDTVRISDSLKRSADASQASVNDLVEGWGNLGPIGTEFGLSMEQINAVLAIFNDRGVRGAEAGTQFRSMLSNMIRPTTAVQDALKKLGISLQDANGDFKDIDAIIGEFQKKTANLTEYDKVQALRTIAGSWGQIGLSILTGLDPDPIAAFIKLSDQLPGSAETAANMMKTFKGAVENLKGSLENLMNTALRPLLEDFLAPLVTQLVGVVNAISELPQPILNAAAATATFVTAFLTLGAVTKLLRGIFMIFGGRTLIGLGGTIKAISTLLFHPIGLIAAFVKLAAVAAPLVALVATAAIAFEALRPIFEEIGTKGTDLNIAFEGMITNIRGLIGDIAEGVSEAWEQIQQTWEQIRSRIGESFGSAGILDLFYNITNTITLVRGQIREFFDWLTYQTAPNDQGERAIESPLSRFIKGVADAILSFKDLAVAAWNQFVKPVLESIGPKLAETWATLKDIDPDALHRFFERLGSSLILIGGAAGLLRLGVLQAVIDSLPRIAQVVSDFVDLVGQKDPMQTADNVRDFLQSLGAAVIGFPISIAQRVLNYLLELAGLPSIEFDPALGLDRMVTAVRDNLVVPLLNLFENLFRGLNHIFGEITRVLAEFLLAIPGQSDQFYEDMRKTLNVSQLTTRAIEAINEIKDDLKAYIDTGEPITITPNFKLADPNEIAARLTTAEKQQAVEAFAKALALGDTDAINILAPIVLSGKIDVAGDIKQQVKDFIAQKLASGDLLEIAPILKLAQDLGIEVDVSALKAQFQLAMDKAVAAGNQQQIDALVTLMPQFEIDPAEYASAYQAAVDKAAQATPSTAAPGGGKKAEVKLPAQVNLGDVTVDQTLLDAAVQKALTDGFANAQTEDEGITNAVKLFSERTGLPEKISSALIETFYSFGPTKRVDIIKLLKLENPQTLDASKLKAIGIEVSGSVADGMEEGLTGALDRIHKAAQGISDIIKLAIGGPQGLDLGSPSRWAEQAAYGVAEGLFNGFMLGLPLIESALFIVRGKFFELRDSIIGAMIEASNASNVMVSQVIPVTMQAAGAVNLLAQAWNNAGMQATMAAAAMQRANAVPPPTPNRERRGGLFSAMEEPTPYRGGGTGRAAMFTGAPEILSGNAYGPGPGGEMRNPLQPTSTSTSYDQSTNWGGITVIVQPGAQGDKAVIKRAVQEALLEQKQLNPAGKMLTIKGRR